RQLHLPGEQRVSVPGDHYLRVPRDPHGRLDDARAVVALQQQPLRRGALCVAALLHAGDLRRHVRRDAQLVVLVDVALGEPLADVQRHLPPAAPLRDAVARVAARHRRRDRRLRARPRAARARRRGRRVTAIVAADHLSKWYGQVIGLNDVTLTVPAGITGLLGPNGAGKSTFMKLVTGQLKPSKGAITVLGEAIWGNPALYHRIGFCPEQDAFYDRMTGLEWVTALVRLNGVSEAEAAALGTHAIEMVELTDAANKKIGAYSKGMRQRVKMAQALVHDPDLLILDEPLAGMDPIARRKTIRMIKEWGRAGKSIIVSSHILHEIESMTANILLINQGRILAEGNVHQIRDLIDEHPHTVHIKAERTRALACAMRVFDLSLGQMLWSRRSVLLGLLLGGPVFLAVVLRVVATLYASGFQINGAKAAGSSIFGLMIWLLYIRFIVPVLGVFYG